MSDINGIPQDDRYRKLGGTPMKPAIGSDDWTPTVGGGGTTNRNGCLVTAIALLGGPWLLDLVLAGSRAAG